MRGAERMTFDEVVVADSAEAAVRAVTRSRKTGVDAADDVWIEDVREVKDG